MASLCIWGWANAVNQRLKCLKLGKDLDNLYKNGVEF